MITFLPKQISSRGILQYAISLAAVSIAFMNYAMDFVWIALGIAEILLFFLLSSRLTVQWQRLSIKDYVKDLFVSALLLRIVWVLFSYYYYQSQTGIPFEFEAADSLGYHEDAQWLAAEPWRVTWFYLFASRAGVSDSGYPLYLTTIYKLFGTNIIVARLLKAVYGAFTCVLLYRLSARWHICHADAESDYLLRFASEGNGIVVADSCILGTRRLCYAGKEIHMV